MNLNDETLECLLAAENTIEDLKKESRMLAEIMSIYQDAHKCPLFFQCKVCKEVRDTHNFYLKSLDKQPFADKT